eukprot:356496-Chlamydomonas_euryale.AAC.3
MHDPLRESVCCGAVRHAVVLPAMHTCGTNHSSCAAQPALIMNTRCVPSDAGLPQHGRERRESSAAACVRARSSDTTFDHPIKF